MIVGLENGQVKEMGSHDQLMETKGIYHQLVTSQSGHDPLRESAILNTSQISFEEMKRLNSRNNEEDEDVMDIQSIISVPIAMAKTKLISETKKFFQYETKLFKMHQPDTLWFVLGVVCQTLHGGVLPGVAFTFSRIYTVIFQCDYSTQFSAGLGFMWIIFAIAIVEVFLVSSYFYSLALVGCRLTSRLRISMLKSILRQEICKFCFFKFKELQKNLSKSSFIDLEFN